MTESRRIFRYELAITDAPSVLLPQGAEVLSVGPPRSGSGYIDLWALVEPDNQLVEKSFRIIGTGNPMPEDFGRFIGSVPILDGRLIFHVFESR